MAKIKPYIGNEPYIFISYAHRNSSDVMPIIERLMHDGYRVWYDEGIVPGKEWDDNIANRIDHCSCMLAMMSEEYMASNNCKDELNYARDLDKPRLLIYLCNVNMPSGMKMRLNRLQAVFKPSYADENEFYAKLYEADDLAVCKKPLEATNVTVKIIPPQEEPNPQQSRIENTYLAAVCDMAEAKTAAEYKAVASKFEALDGYKNSSELIGKCYEKAAEITEYEKATEKLEACRTKENLIAFISYVEGNKTLKDRDIFLAKANEMLADIVNGEYEAACKLFNNATTEDDVIRAASKFKQIKNHEPSKEMIRRCEDKLSDIKRQRIYEEELAENTIQLHEAMRIMDNAKSYADFMLAANQFKDLGHFSTAPQLRVHCLNKAKEFIKVADDAHDALLKDYSVSSDDTLTHQPKDFAQNKNYIICTTKGSEEQIKKYTELYNKWSAIQESKRIIEEHKNTFKYRLTYFIFYAILTVIGILVACNLGNVKDSTFFWIHYSLNTLVMLILYGTMSNDFKSLSGIKRPLITYIFQIALILFTAVLVTSRYSTGAYPFFLNTMAIVCNIIGLASGISDLTELSGYCTSIIPISYEAMLMLFYVTDVTATGISVVMMILTFIAPLLIAILIDQKGRSIAIIPIIVFASICALNWIAVYFWGFYQVICCIVSFFFVIGSTCAFFEE